MANIQLLLNNYGQDMDQDDDDYSHYYESTMLDETNPDDLLSPLEKLRKYFASENIFNRQVVARNIIEAVQSIQSKQECLTLLEIITKLADDFEPSVRCELMEQLPPCCLMIMDMQLVPDAISGFLLPVMVKYLADSNNQVRKLSQNALLQLIDQDMLQRIDVEHQICPVLLTLTEPDSGDDFRTEAVALMTKITPFIGSEAAERSFLKRFGELCADPLFHVRKVCAASFDNMTSVMSLKTVEQHLLPLFARLCEDSVWGVRKSCAETFMAVSNMCSRQVRYERLSPLFVGLLCDKSRWVQMAAYQALGQFIATFADPERSGFDVDEEGMLIRYHNNDTSLSGLSEEMPSLIEDPSLESDRQTEATVPSLTETSTNETTAISSTTTETTTTIGAEEEFDKNFNNFEFWRTPLPNVQLEDIQANIASLSIIDTDENQSQNQIVTEVKNTDNDTANSIDNNATSNDSEDGEKSDTNNPNDEQFSDIVISDDNILSSTTTSQSEEIPPSFVTSAPSNEFLRMDQSESHGFHSDSEEEDDHSRTVSLYASSLLDEESLRRQSTVPPALLEHYISMTEPRKAQTIDVDLPRHCAFTLPGVVLALGAEHWALLKDTYELLSTDMQWKVRRTLAFSIHDLAIILGETICVKDLVPVFNGFLKDLDEVRVGVLKHLYDFISILPSEMQKDYLQLFREFQKTDNMRNWRFRQDLAVQLMNLSTLYNEEELSEYFCPVALDLASDKVAEVRQHAFQLLCILMKKLYNPDSASEEKNHFLHKFIVNIVGMATHHQHWVKRKACAQIYLMLIEEGWYEQSRFAKDFLPSLVNLSSDNVPNIRLIAAKCLLSFMKSEYFQSLPEDDEVRKCVDHAVECLQTDSDRDVRYFSGGKYERTPSLFDAEVDYTQQMAALHGNKDGMRMTLDDEEIDEIVEEVYVQEHSTADVYEGDVVIKEYYLENPQTGERQYLGKQVNAENSPAPQVYVEEIVEEIIETIPQSSVTSETSSAEEGGE